MKWNHIKLNPNRFPYVSVVDRILPPDLLFEVFVVAWPTLVLFVVAATAFPTNGLATLTADLRNISQVLLFPLLFLVFHFEIHHVFIKFVSEWKFFVFHSYNFYQGIYHLVSKNLFCFGKWTMSVFTCSFFMEILSFRHLLN